MLISIIIITLNEAYSLPSTIKAARDAAKFSDGRSLPLEIIVCDGGSDDDTLEVANELADKVIKSPRGRYKQLNAGARASKGGLLLFLHADTLLPEGALLRIKAKMNNLNVSGGSFKKYWNWDKNIKLSSFLKFLNYWWQGIGNWLVRLMKTIPGDNAIFVRKSIFEELNGFADLWICEDFDFIKRLKRYGRKNVTYIRSAVLTSTRRFEKYGYLRTVLFWFFIYWFWWLGMSSVGLEYRFKKYSMIPEKGNRTYLRF